MVTLSIYLPHPSYPPIYIYGAFAWAHAATAMPRPCHGHATAMHAMHGHFHCHATVMNACPKRCMMERARVYRNVKAQPCPPPPIYIYTPTLYTTTPPTHPIHPWVFGPKGPNGPYAKCLSQNARANCGEAICTDHHWRPAYGCAHCLHCFGNNARILLAYDCVLLRSFGDLQSLILCLN